jgi:undecaprenol kinase
MDGAKNQAFRARLGFAAAGLRAAWKREHSFRTQAIIGLATIPVLMWLQPAPVWWALVGTMAVLVLALELMNSALETLIDHLHPSLHPQIKVVKDMAAAAVLMACAGAVLVAVLLAFSVLP